MSTWLLCIGLCGIATSLGLMAAAIFDFQVTAATAFLGLIGSIFLFVAGMVGYNTQTKG